MLHFDPYPKPEPSYFYDVPGVEFVWRGSWNDPLVKYKGSFFNYWLLENSLWELWKEEDPNTRMPFEYWVIQNPEIVYSLLEECICTLS